MAAAGVEEEGEATGGAELVCRPWHRATRDESSLWRRIDLRFSHLPNPSSYRFLPMSHAAIRALSLKSLGLINCVWINDRISHNMSHLVMLEDHQEISNCSFSTFSSICFAVGYSCPRLKRFRLSSFCFIKRPVWGPIDSQVGGDHHDAWAAFVAALCSDY
ncbi:hypothetical protein ZWY2020_045797 [Hordeum vulgare]|nr:hypothetical protein ZWY2020_045797 [Hordeum vulgare]